MTRLLLQKSKFGVLLKTTRKNQKISQAKLAQKTGLNRNTIVQLEQGKGYIDNYQATLHQLNHKITARQLPSGTFLGERIKKLRKRRNISQRDLAELTNFPQKTIWRLENQKGSRILTVEKIFTILGIEKRLIPYDQKENFFSHAATSSAFDSWTTPQKILIPLYEIFGTFDLDPCSPTHTPNKAPVKALNYFTIENNGLELEWFGNVYMNPPYGRGIKDWTSKAHHEVKSGHAQSVVALLPARTDTLWWHKDVSEHAKIWFLKGRLKFGATSNAAPFASALVGWGLSNEQKQQISQAFPESFST